MRLAEAWVSRHSEVDRENDDDRIVRFDTFRRRRLFLRMHPKPDYARKFEFYAECHCPRVICTSERRCWQWLLGAHSRRGSRPVVEGPDSSPATAAVSGRERGRSETSSFLRLWGQR